MAQIPAPFVDLRRAAEGVAAAARQARLWTVAASQDAAPVAAEAAALMAAARRTESQASRIARSAQRRLSIGIYGASQQGKSYLVSVLARPAGAQPLLVRLGGQTNDFLRDINPQGGKESTGLVTRFTSALDSGESDPDYPVDLVLLGELDLVRILANAFHSDFDQNNLQLPVPDGAAIRALLAQTSQRRRPKPVAAHLDEIALAELSEYFSRFFKQRYDDLAAIGYWPALIDGAPLLALADRAALFAVLWGNLADFSQVFLALTGILEELGHAGEAVVGAEALMPRQTSIIDVAALTPPAGGGDPLRLRARRDGKLLPATRIARHLLAALIAELRLTLAQQTLAQQTASRAVLAETDILDFPGARSRLKLTSLPPASPERSRQITEMLLRGKIAWLFQRYTEERELTALLLCMGNKPNEVKDLGRLVQHWTELTHGRDPAARRKLPKALFLVLTMMDLEFMPKAGEGPDAIATKWDIRLHSALLEPFRHEGWPENFDGGPFDNCLLLRNPNFRQDHLVEYATAPDSDEPLPALTEIAPARRARRYIDALHQSFLASALVRRHIAEPELVWQAMFELNDGGVRYLVERLGGVLRWETRQQQLWQRLIETAQNLHDTLKHFYHGTDAQSRREKEAALRALRQALQQALRGQGYRPFGRLLGALMLAEREIRETALGIAELRIEEAILSTAGMAQDASGDDDIFGSAPAAPASAPLLRRNDRPARFARDILERWARHARDLAQQEPLLRHFGVLDRHLAEIAEQLIVAADRLQLETRIAQAVREATDVAGLRWEDMADRIVPIAGELLNRHVAHLGFDRLPLAQRPGFQENAANPERRIFAPPPILPGGLPELDEHGPAELELRHFVDWGIGFLRLGLDNLDHGSGRVLSADLNADLGRLLDALRQPLETGHERG